MSSVEAIRPYLALNFLSKPRNFQIWLIRPAKNIADRPIRVHFASGIYSMICKDVCNIKTQMGHWKGCQSQVVDSIKLLQKGIFQNSTQARTSESESVMKMNLMVSQCHRLTDHTRSLDCDVEQHGTGQTSVLSE
jgi:hypothetical protein